MAGIVLNVMVDPGDRRRFDAAVKRLLDLGRSPRVPFGRTALYIIRAARRLLRARAHDWGPMTGNLGKSLTYLLDSMSVTVGSNLVYAAIQQLGGTVEPKGHKYLAIPVLAALRRGGVWPRDIPKGSMKFAIAEIRLGSHSWTGPALVRTRAVERVGKDGKTRTIQRAGQVMYALIRRARIRGREYLVFKEPARRFLFDELQREATRRWRK